MESYKKWVRANKGFVNSLESLANGLTWFLPERFSQSDIGPEAVAAMLGIATAINSHIMDTMPPWTLTPQFQHRHSSFPYSLCITSIGYLQSLVEVAAQQIYGDDAKWNSMAFIEAAKALMRLALFQKSGYRMLLHGGEVVNDGACSRCPAADRSSRPLDFGGKKTMKGLEKSATLALSSLGESTLKIGKPPTWLQMVRHQNRISTPADEVPFGRRLSQVLCEDYPHGGAFVASEVLHTLRPLIYVLCVRKYGIRSWRPWLLSLFLDFTSVGFCNYYTRAASSSSTTDAETNEGKRRRLNWALYLMRDPFFIKYTRKRLHSAEGVVEHVPLIGFLATKIIELIDGAQARYTYLSAS